MSSLCILQLPHTSMSSTTKKIHQSLQLKRHWVCISMSTTTSKTHRVHTSTSTTNSKTHKVHTSMSTTNSKANDPKLALDSHRHVPNHHKDPHHWFSRDLHRLVFNHHKDPQPKTVTHHSMSIRFIQARPQPSQRQMIWRCNSTCGIGFTPAGLLPPQRPTTPNCNSPGHEHWAYTSTSSTISKTNDLKLPPYAALGLHKQVLYHHKDQSSKTVTHQSTSIGFTLAIQQQLGCLDVATVSGHMQRGQVILGKETITVAYEFQRWYTVYIWQ